MHGIGASRCNVPLSEPEPGNDVLSGQGGTEMPFRDILPGIPVVQGNGSGKESGNLAEITHCTTAPPPICIRKWPFVYRAAVRDCECDVI